MNRYVKTLSRILAVVMLLSSISMPVWVSAAADTASGTCGENLTWTLTEDGTLTISGTGDMVNYRYSNVPWNDMYYTSAVIEEGVTSISYNAFAYSRYMKTVSIPTTMKYIGEYAFIKCPSLTDVYYAGNSIQWDMIDIDNTSFSNVNIIFGDTSNSISGSCGEDLTWTLTEDGTLTISGTGDMYDYYYSDRPWHGMYYTSVVIEEGVASIGYAAFSNSRCLNSVTIPLSVKKIGLFAFSKSPISDVYYAGNRVDWMNAGLDTEFELYDNIVIHFAKAEEDINGTYGDNITWTLSKDGTLVLSGSGDMSLDYNNKSSIWSGYYIKNVIIEEGITSIGCYSFAGTSLASISIPSTVTRIDNNAFFICESLSSVTIPGSVETIAEFAFYACDLSSVTISEGVKNIGDYAFLRCNNLSSVTLPSTIEKIGRSALCGNIMEDIYYNGTEKQWTSVDCAEGGYDGTLHFTAKGDVNGDGRINSKDSNLMKRAIMGAYELSDDEFRAADIYVDGIINTKDLYMVKMLIIDG